MGKAGPALRMRRKVIPLPGKMFRRSRPLARGPRYPEEADIGHARFFTRVACTPERPWASSVSGALPGICR